MITEVQTLDSILNAHAHAIGGDFVAYRNHAYRVLNLCIAFAPAETVALEKVAIAAAFHDLGIWTDGTFDYLKPSAKLAIEHLTIAGLESWIHEIEAMILEHHKVTPYQPAGLSLVESFRRADWVDVSRGVVTFGLPRQLIAELYGQWPSAGFHRRLVALWLGRLRTHPLSSLPMLRF